MLTLLDRECECRSIAGWDVDTQRQRQQSSEWSSSCIGRVAATVSELQKRILAELHCKCFMAGQTV